MTQRPKHTTGGLHLDDATHLLDPDGAADDGNPGTGEVNLRRRPDPRGIYRCLCGFGFAAGVWTSYPQRIFKPRGLVIWGAPPGAVLRQATIGQKLEVTVSCEGVPVKFFAFGDSYAQIGKLLDEGKEPPAWCSWSSVIPGSLIRIDIASADGRALTPKDGIELCMWGETVL